MRELDIWGVDKWGLTVYCTVCGHVYHAFEMFVLFSCDKHMIYTWFTCNIRVVSG